MVVVRLESLGSFRVFLLNDGVFSAKLGKEGISFLKQVFCAFQGILKLLQCLHNISNILNLQ